MSNLVVENITRFICDKRKILIFVIFAWFCENELILADSVNMSVYEYVIFLMGNHYYVIYFLLISYLYFSFYQIKKTSNCVNIRLKFLRNKYLIQFLSTFIQTMILVVTHFFVAFIIGITRLKLVNSFQTKMFGEYYNDTLSFVYEYKKYFSNPMSAMIAIGLYMVLGLSFLGMIIFIINEIKGNKITMVILGGLIFNIMLGFKMNVHGIVEIFFLNNYFILHHVLFLSGLVWTLVNILIEGILLYMMFRILKKTKGNKKYRNDYLVKMFKPVYKVSIVFLLSYIMINCIFVYVQNNKYYPIDGILVNLLGYSSERFFLLELIKHILYFAIPLFFWGRFLESEKQMYNDQVKIRYRNKKEWNKLVSKNIGLYVLTYVLVFNVLITLLYVLSIPHITFIDKSLDELFGLGINISKKLFIYVLILSCVLKILELIYYKNILIIFSNIFKNRVIAYLFTVSGFFLSVMSSKPVISYGRSSLYYLFDNTVVYGFEKLSLILLGILIIKIVIIRLIIKWRISL